MLYYHAVKVKEEWRPTVLAVSAGEGIKEGFPEGEYQILWQSDDLWSGQQGQSGALGAAKDMATLVSDLLADPGLAETLQDELRDVRKELKELKEDVKEIVLRPSHAVDTIWDCTGTTSCDCMERRDLLKRIQE